MEQRTNFLNGELELWRQQRAVTAMWGWNKFLYENGRDTTEYSDGRYLKDYLQNEYLNQLALGYLGMSIDQSPDHALGINTMIMQPEGLASLRDPYVVEVLGMPGAGKTTMLKRYMQNRWKENSRGEIGFLVEEVRGVLRQHKDLRKNNPFKFSILFGAGNYAAANDILTVQPGVKYLVTDRGQTDRRVWRRMRFEQGFVSPKVMTDEENFMRNMEFNPAQLGGVIMVLIDPETSLKRIDMPGEHPIRNEKVLPMMYEQYLRLHAEFRQDIRPTRLYGCIDGSKNPDEVYEYFEWYMDTALGMRELHMASLIKYPEIYEDFIQDRIDAHKPFLEAEEMLSKRFGYKVRLIGDDYMDPVEISGRKNFVGHITQHGLKKGIKYSNTFQPEMGVDEAMKLYMKELDIIS